MNKFPCLKSVVFLVVVCAYAVALFGCGPSKREWQKAQATGPDAREDQSMVYDGYRERAILFGGWNGGDNFGDTWEWDGDTWSKTTSSGPKARFSHVMAFDNARKKVVMFGGRADRLLGDTWEWDGHQWTQFSESGPSPRCDAAMIYDEARGKVLLFGGIGGGLGAILSGEEVPAPRKVVIESETQRITTTVFGDHPDSCRWLGDTWHWDGQAWSKASDSGPSERYDHALAYDAARKKIVLFGGIGKQGKPLGDTWEWDGQTWTQVALTGPDPRFGHTLVYDNMLDRVILLGGCVSEVVDAKLQRDAFGFSNRLNTVWSVVRMPANDIWHWDGKAWNRSDQPGPPARYFHSMALDDARDRIVVFGGHDSKGRLQDTWEYRP